MKLTIEEFSKKVNSYLDDSYSYGDHDVTVSENVLKSISMLSENENGIDKNRLSELAENSTGESKYIIEDFILYLENI